MEVDQAQADADLGELINNPDMLQQLVSNLPGVDANPQVTIFFKFNPNV